jgi:hypothetical protein
VSDTAPAYMAFKLLDAKNVGGVAVVDGAVSLVSTRTGRM